MNYDPHARFDGFERASQMSVQAEVRFEPALAEKSRSHGPSLLPKLLRIWIYTTFVVIFIGGLGALMARDWRVFLPIGVLSAMVGGIGTFMTLLSSASQRSTHR